MFEIILWILLALVVVNVFVITIIIVFAKEVPEDVYQERTSYYKAENENE